MEQCSIIKTNKNKAIFIWNYKSQLEKAIVTKHLTRLYFTSHLINLFSLSNLIQQR